MIGPLKFVFKKSVFINIALIFCCVNVFTMTDLTAIIENEESLPINWNESGVDLQNKNAALIPSAVSPSADRRLLGDDYDTAICEHKMERTPTKNAFSSMPNLSLMQPPDGIPVSSTLNNANGAFFSTTRSVSSSLGSRATPNSFPYANSSRRMTLKEYEEQLDKLKKENFNLRVWISLHEKDMPKFNSLGDIISENLRLQEKIAELTQKEQLLKESGGASQRLTVAYQQQLADLKDEYQKEIERLRNQMAERVAQLEKALGETRHRLSHAEQENERLNDLLPPTNRQSAAGESDSDISLLSARERIIFELKARVALLEDIQASTSLNETRRDHEDNTPRANFLSDTMEVGTIMEDGDVTVALLNQVQEKDARIAELESEITRLKNQLDKFVHGSKQVSNNSDDEKLRALEAELLAERADGIKRNNLIKGLINTIYKERKQRAASQRQENADVQTGASLFPTPPPTENDHVEGGQMEGEHDSTSFVQWLNETMGLQQREHDDLFRRRVAEFQSIGESLYDRLKRVAENLEQYAQNLRTGAVTANSTMLVSNVLSNELSLLKHDLHESLMNATYHITSALAPQAAAQQQQNESAIGIDKSMQVSSMAPHSNTNRSAQAQPKQTRDFSQMFTPADAVCRTTRDQLAQTISHRTADRGVQTKESKLKTVYVNKGVQVSVIQKKFTDISVQCNISTGIFRNCSSQTDQTAGEIFNDFGVQTEVLENEELPDSDSDQLLLRVSKLERYAKMAKAKYRKLEKERCGNCIFKAAAGKNSGEEQENEAVDDEKKENDVWQLLGDMNAFLDPKQQRELGLDKVVRELELCNDRLAERLDEHERRDTEMTAARKRDAAKIKELENEIRNFRQIQLQQRKMPNEKK